MARNEAKSSGSLLESLHLSSAALSRERNVLKVESDALIGVFTEILGESERLNAAHRLELLNYPI
jgi:hypothetical protein